MDQGWIPYENRDDYAKTLSDRWDNDNPLFGDINAGPSDVPETALLYDLEIRATGKLLNRYGQYEGSCVGVGWANAVTQAMCGDAVVRNTAKISWTCSRLHVGRFATYRRAQSPRGRQFRRGDGRGRRKVGHSQIRHARFARATYT